MRGHCLGIEREGCFLSRELLWFVAAKAVPDNESEQEAVTVNIPSMGTLTTTH